MIHLGGRFVAPEDAVVPLLDRGYLLGDGVFVTMRGYAGRCFRAGAHLAELARGAALFGFELPLGPDELAALADEVARRTGEADAYVRVTLTRGAPGGPPTLSILARAMDVPPADAYRDGVAVVTVSARRAPPACGDPSIKTTSYAPQVLARREAESKGAFEGVQLAVDGALASATMANLFLVQGDVLFTPSLESGCRAGTRRAVVLELARELFREVREARLEPSDLRDADEAFLTSTRVECIPIATVDGRPVGRRTFARTYALRQAFVERVRSEVR